MSRTMLAHVGYHKTGTSWLQQTLFAQPPFRQPWGSMTIADALILPHELDFDPAEARQSLVLHAGPADRQDEVTVLSWERLSGSPHAGGYDSGTIARRIHACFPDARVLIGIREQRGAILALYRQYVRDGGIARLEGYLKPRNPAEMPQFRFEHLEYDRLIEHYIGLFGQERVLVLPFEDLKADANAFAASICRFVGADPPPRAQLEAAPINARLSDLTTVVKRHANKILVRNSLSPGARYYVKDHEHRFERLNGVLRLLPGGWLEGRWRDLVDAGVGARYQASNRRLAQLIDRDLAALGYDVGD